MFGDIYMTAVINKFETKPSFERSFRSQMNFRGRKQIRYTKSAINQQNNNNNNNQAQ